MSGQSEGATAAAPPATAGSAPPATGGSAPSPLTGAAAALRVFRISALNPIRRKRSIVLLLLTFLPVIPLVIAELCGVERGRGSRFFTVVMVPIYHYIEMVVYIFVGCSVLGDDIESRNITYDLVCPVSRPALFFGRYLSYLVSALILVMPALVSVYMICMARVSAEMIVHNLYLLWAILIATVTGALVYGAAFLFLSLIVKRAIFAIIIAIVLSVCIEGFVANIPLRVSSCSVLYHLQNVMYGISGEIGFFPISGENDLLKLKGVYEVTTFDSVLTLVLLWVGFMVGSLLMFRRKEFA